jgi:hypothetical protein
MSVSDIPLFEDAVTSFQRFLADQSHPSEIFWVFREDIWKRSGEVLLRFPSRVRNEAIAKKVFEEGRKKGLVEISAIASAGHQVAATLWFPKFVSEEVQGWSRGLKLSIAKPLPAAKFVGGPRWLCFRLHPQFQHYQRSESLIGTKAWAKAPTAALSADSR